jgi:3-keto-disaccharide hydrolase
MKRIAVVVAGLIVFTAASSLTPRVQAQGGWTTLFDGKNIDAFNKVGDANWTIADGVLQADKGMGGYLVTKQPYTDFEIRAEFWVDTPANSGIFIRCDNPQMPGAEACYEVNIFDTRPDPAYGTGAIVNVAKVATPIKAGGKWNTYEIRAQGAHLTVTLNGMKTADVQDTKHARGPFALQYGAGVVKFRKVEVRPL